MMKNKLQVVIVLIALTFANLAVNSALSLDFTEAAIHGFTALILGVLFFFKDINALENMHADVKQSAATCSYLNEKVNALTKTVYNEIKADNTKLAAYCNVLSKELACLHTSLAKQLCQKCKPGDIYLSSTDGENEYIFVGFDYRSYKADGYKNKQLSSNLDDLVHTDAIVVMQTSVGEKVQISLFDFFETMKPKKKDKSNSLLF